MQNLFNSYFYVETEEIKKLHKMLEAADIPHVFKPHTLGTGFHLFYPTTENCVCSAITTCGSYGSYGWEKGLIEIMGLLTEKEEATDEVVGHLTASNVFNRIKKHYYENN